MEVKGEGGGLGMSQGEGVLKGHEEGGAPSMMLLLGE